MRGAPWLCVCLLCSSWAAAAEYEVGPGKALESIGAVPWESLEAGDVVLIHHRAEPYREKFVLCRRGTESAPIIVRGVLGPNGERPVLDGRDATTRPALNYWNEARGLIKIGGANQPADTLPAWIVVENLELRSAREPYQFTGRDGPTAYAKNAAALYVEKGEHLIIRNCVMRDSGNGLFIGASDGASQDILISGCHLYDNGNEGSAYEHNSYTAAIDITFEYNHYGPLRAGCDGNNLKDRSAGLVVRYNWLEAGNRQLDLVDAEDSEVLVSHPSYGETQVYGNILIEPEGAGNSQIVHYGGDSGTTDDYRKGTLYFHHNTVISTRSGNTTLLRLSTNDEHADVRNNIIWASAGGGALALINGDGQVTLSHNWLNEGFRLCHCTPDGQVDDDGTQLVGVAPGFVDAASQDFSLAAGSPAIDQGAALATAAHPVLQQYLKHQQGEPRPSDGPMDLGAFERCSSGACSPLPPIEEQPEADLEDFVDTSEPVEVADETRPEAEDEQGQDVADSSDSGQDLSQDLASDQGELSSQSKDEGCGCRMGRPLTGSGVPALLALAFFAAALLRRRAA